MENRFIKSETWLGEVPKGRLASGSGTRQKGISPISVWLGQSLPLLNQCDENVRSILIAFHDERPSETFGGWRLQAMIDYYTGLTINP